jgi:hypothetical protein
VSVAFGIEPGPPRRLVGEAVDLLAWVENQGPRAVDLPPLRHRAAAQPLLTLTGPGRFARGVTRRPGLPEGPPAARPLGSGRRDETLLALTRLFDLAAAEPGRYVLEARFAHDPVDARARVELTLELPAPVRPALGAGEVIDRLAFLQAGRRLYVSGDLRPEVPDGARPRPTEWHGVGVGPADDAGDDVETFVARRARRGMAGWVGWRAGGALAAVPFLSDPRPIAHDLGQGGPWRLVDAPLARADEGLDVLALGAASLRVVRFPPQELGAAPRAAGVALDLPAPPGARARARLGPAGRAHVALAWQVAGSLLATCAPLDAPRAALPATGDALALLADPDLSVDAEGGARVAVLALVAPRTVACLEAAFAPDGAPTRPLQVVDRVELDGPWPVTGGLVRYPLRGHGPPRWVAALDPLRVVTRDGPRALRLPAALPLVGEVDDRGLQVLAVAPGRPPTLVTLEG